MVSVDAVSRVLIGFVHFESYFAPFVAVGTDGAVVGSLLTSYPVGVDGDRVSQRYDHLLSGPDPRPNGAGRG